MNNYYVKRMEEIEARYKGKFKNIIELMKVEVEKAQTLREDLKIDTLNFLVEEAKKEVREIKEKYFDEYNKVLEETMPIPKATNYTELDLKLMKLNMLASKDKENIDNLMDILNHQDFNINKGQLLEIALLKNDSDLISKIYDIEVLTEEDFRKECRAIVGSRIINNDFVPGLDMGYRTMLKTEGLNNYIDRIGGISKVSDLFNTLGLVDNEIDFVSTKEYREAPLQKVSEKKVESDLYNSLGYVDNQSNFESKEYSEVAKKEATGEFFN